MWEISLDFLELSGATEFPAAGSSPSYRFVDFYIPVVGEL